MEKCTSVLETFCGKIFGTDYLWLHHQNQDICGKAFFQRRKGVNIAHYAAVSTYQGEADSILGRVFISFLVLMIFIWVMLMISEFRHIYNFVYVVWNMRSTDNSDPDFVTQTDALKWNFSISVRDPFYFLGYGLSNIYIYEQK